MRAFLALLLLSLWSGLALAQSLDGDAEAAEEDNGYFISLLEDQLSTESRKIRLSGIDGLLSSKATVKRITISDPDGVWLQIDNATVDWSRTALLSGAVQINELSAERIRIPRGPAPEPGLPDSEASGGIAVPDLPVSVALDLLRVDRIELGKELAGTAAAFRTEGKLSLDGGAFNTTLTLDRLDGPGGRFALTASVAGDPVTVDVDLDLTEPQGGVVATALGIEGAPPMQVKLTAAGPLEDLSGTLDLLLDGEDLVDGTLKLAQAPAGLAAELALAGRLRPLLPPSLHAFFEGESTINAVARQLQDGGIALDRLTVATGGLRLNGALSTAADGFPQALELTAELGHTDGRRLQLPGEGASIAEGQLRLTYGSGERWNGAITLDNLRSGDLRVATVAVDLGGIAENLREPAARRLTGDIDGTVSGITSAETRGFGTLGEAIALAVQFDWQSGQPLLLKLAEVQSGTARLGLTGLVDGTEFQGRATIDVPDLNTLSTLAGRRLAGVISLSTEGQVDPLTGLLNLVVEGTTSDLTLGIAQADALLAGETTLGGLIRRTTDGLFAEDFTIRNDQLSLLADGVYAPARTDFDFNAEIVDIATLTPDARGRLRLVGRADGADGVLGLDVRLLMDDGTLLGRSLQGAEFAVTASGTHLDDLTGTLSGDGTLDRAPLDLSGRFSLDDGVQSLRELALRLGQTELAGTVVRGTDGLLAGTVDIAIPDLAEPAAFALVEASGRAQARAMLFRSAGRQMVDLTADLSGLDIAGVQVTAAAADVVAEDLFGLPLLDGTVAAEGAVVAGYGVDTLDLTAKTEAEAMRVEAKALLDNGTDIALGGVLERLATPGGFAVALEQLVAAFKGERIELTAPTRVEIAGGEVTLEPLQLSVAGGRITASGRIGEALDLDVALDALPLDVANAFVPELGAQGVLTGKAVLSGSPQAPQGQFEIDARGLTAAVVADLGLPPADLSATGALGGDRVDLQGRVALGQQIVAQVAGRVPFAPDAPGLSLKVTLERLALEALDTLAGGQGLRGEVTGTADLTGQLNAPSGQATLRATGVSATATRAAGLGDLALDLDTELAGDTATVDGLVTLATGGRLFVEGSLPIDPGTPGLSLDLALEAFPLAALNQVAGNAGLSGTLSATAQARGALADPSVRFDVTARQVSATALRSEGIAALDVAASGGFASNVVTLERASLSGPDGLAFQADGAIPLAGPGLDVRAEGQVPLSLADVALASSQSQMQGILSIDGRARGALSAPNLDARLSLADGTFVNAPANLRLNDLTLEAAITGTRLAISRASANPAQGGSIAVQGSIDLNPAAGLPADLDIAIRQAFYTDGTTVSTQVTGDLSLDGPVLGAGQLSGRVRLDRTEISLRGGFGISSGVLLDIRHRAPPNPVLLTLDRARIDELRAEQQAAGAGGPSLGLDVAVNVPNKLFIRGRGVDAELGGQVLVRGTLNDIQPTGAIELLRGRLSILGQRIDFDEGEVALIGDLEPRIRLVAETEAPDGTVITVRVSGLASDPQIELSSVPELPEDEVLAQLIYGRNVADLSPFQIAQLAAAVATLSGGGDGVVGGFRSAVGLADLDITSSEEGGVGVRAGAYLSDNIYLDVEADAAGDSEATVNIDFSRFLKGKVSVDNRGESSFGLFFEKDY